MVLTVFSHRDSTFPPFSMKILCYIHSGARHGFSPGLVFISYWTIDKLFSPCMSQFPHSWNGDNNIVFLIRLLWRLNESSCVTGLERVLDHGEYPVDVSCCCAFWYHYFTISSSGLSILMNTFIIYSEKSILFGRFRIMFPK